MSDLPGTAFLQTERLAFGHWTPADFELARSLWGDARVMRWIGRACSDDEVRERLEGEIEAQKRVGVQYWPMFRVADGEFVGCCGLRARVGEVALELGFHLRSEHWGRGYATEAARAVVEHAFETLGVSELFAGHHPENLASRRILEGLGFRRVADELYPPTGRLHPSYRLAPDAWRRVRGRATPGA